MPTMLSEKQWQIFCFGSTSYDALICDGAIRSGKTSVMSVAFIEWAMENFDRCNFIIGGVSVESSKRNVINPIMSTQYILSQYAVTWMGTSNCLVVANNKKVNNFYVFGGQDESSFRKVQGLTAAGCFLDEVVLMPRSFVEQCLARCSVDGSKLWFSCNPGSPSHWFYENWVTRCKEQNAYRIHFSLRDNPSLSEHVIKRYESMYTGVFKSRYVDGEWVAAEGVVYPMWRDALESGWEPSEEDEQTGYCISIDYGTMNPFAAIKWKADSNGKWHAVEEYYYCGRSNQVQKTDSEYVEDMIEFCKDKTEGQAEVIVDPSAASFIVALRKTGMFKVRKADNSVVDGIRNTSVCLKSKLIGISDSLKNVRAEFESYSWDDKKGDAPIKENDHAMDAIRYFVMTKRVYNPKKEYHSVF